MPAAATAIVPHIRALPAPPTELEELFREHHERIFRAAYRITGNAVDSEDVLQTVFLRLVRRGGGSDGDSVPLDLAPSPASYLLRAAVNAALDVVRGRNRTKSVPLDDAAELTAHPALNPETQQINRETRKLVQQSIARLGPSAAEMFVLRYFEDYDNREIAQLLGTTQMVVAVVLHRARTRVRKEINQFLETHHEA